MNDLTRLSRPTQTTTKVDMNVKQSLSDGFNFPSFRLLNKQARVSLSQNNLSTTPGFSYRILAIANSKGWFAAVKNDGGFSIILSPLSDLRAACINGETNFNPQRTIPIQQAEPSILTFALNDSRLIVGVKQGLIAVYDTATLFSPGNQEVQPLNHLQNTDSPPVEILTNPSSAPALCDNVAILRADGTIQMVNSRLEPQGGWAPGDFDSTPVAVSWSPKGKQIAIGLRHGDICTFTLENKSAPQKHLPPTAQGELTGLTWLSPGHTFRVSYSSSSGGNTAHQLLYLDTKTATVTFTSLTYPWPSGDRNRCNPQIISFPRWDEASVANDEHKTLVVVGDVTSVDLEILAVSGMQWYQQSQENPLSIPLDKNQDDTFLLGLGVDLTDSDRKLPILYAYLNDGTIQAWYMDHSVPYLGLLIPEAASVASAPQQSAFGQPAATSSTFGQSSFGQPSTFGQPASGFGQQSAFGQSSFGQTQQQPTFGQTSTFGGSTQNSAFGSSQPSAFGSQSSAFGQSPSSVFGGGSSSFGSSTTTGGFGAFSGTPTAFGQGSFTPTPPTEMTREASMSDETLGGLSLGESNSAFKSSTSPGGGMFGPLTSSPAPLPLPPNHAANQPSNNSFGSNSSAFGSNSFGGGGGGFIKPASGFGNNFNSDSPFAKPAAPLSSSFAVAPEAPKPAAAHPAFGSSGFGTAPAVTSAFGGGTSTFSAFSSGSNSFGAAKTTAPASGAFSQFATKPATFGSALQDAGKSTGGFSSFASSGPSAFASQSNTTTSAIEPAKPNTGFGSTSAFGTQSPGTSAIEPAKPNSGFAAFANPASTGKQSSNTTPSEQPKSSGGFGSFASTSPSPFGSSASESNKSPFGAGTSAFGQSSSTPTPAARSSILDSPPSPQSPPSPSPSPVANKTASSTSGNSAFPTLKSSSSAFSAGHGAFGNTVSADSPFLKATSASKTPAVNAFSALAAPAVNPSSSASSTPKFGAPSMLGGAFKSTFGAPVSAVTPTPAKTPTSSAFDAYTKSSPAGFSSFAGPTKSFAELSAASADAGTQPSESPKSAFAPFQASPVFTAPPEEDSNKPQGIPSPPAITGEPSLESISSQASSYVVVTDDDDPKPESAEETEVPSSDRDADVDDADADGENEEDDPEDEDYLSDERLTTDSGSVSEDELPEDELPEDENEDDSSVTPTQIPLPASRSPSATPQEELLEEGSESESEGSSSGKLSTIAEETNTPPGSPEKPPPITKTVSAPVIAAPGPVFGLGRPSTRPTRSSPLATASVSLDEEEDSEIEVKSSSPKLSPVARIVPLEDEPKSKPARPQTPPLLSAFSAPKPAAAAIPAASSIFGKPATPPGSKQASSPSPNELPKSQTGVFGGAMKNFDQKLEGLGPQLKQLASEGKLLAPGASPTEALGKPPGPSTVPSPTTLAPQSKVMLPSPTSQSVAKPIAPSFGVSSPGIFGSKPMVPPATPQGPPAGRFLVPSAPVLPAKHTPEPDLEDGMQKECALLFAAMNKDLEDLRLLAQHTTAMREKLTRRASGGFKRKEDLGDPSKWELKDIGRFGTVLKTFQADLTEASSSTQRQKDTLKDIRGSMLKAMTRKEEIARFHKAKRDNDFARLLKTRTLGPEHLETQMQLRRNVRAIHTRIQQLEDHIRASKKKISEFKTGKPGFHAPSLDTINRSYKNIDIAINQQSAGISRLTERVAKLDLTAPYPSFSQSRRDPRLPDAVTPSSRPFNITPHIAITTAAALNSERSAQRLKKALLAVRNEPILNIQGTLAPKPPVSFATPGRPSPGLTFNSPITMQLPAAPGWDDFPEDNFSPGSGSASSRRGAGLAKKHAGSVQLRKMTDSPPKPPSSFQWGPLPDFGSSNKSLKPSGSFQSLR